MQCVSVWGGGGGGGGTDSLVQPGEGSPILPCLHILSSLPREGGRGRGRGRRGQGGRGREKEKEG